MQELWNRLKGINREVNDKGETHSYVCDIDAFRKIKDEVTIIYEARPQDKYLFVLALKQTGEIVCTTGDQPPDVDCLMLSDVGVCFSNTALDVAKEAASVIIEQNSFKQFIHLLCWGRTINENIRKFVQFQLIINFSVIAIELISAIVTGEVVFSPVQLIWINLIIDSLAGLSFTAEESNFELEKIKNSSESCLLITSKVTKHIICEAVYIVAYILVLLFAGEYFIPESEEYWLGVPIFNGKNVRTGRKYTYDNELGQGYLTELYSSEILSVHSLSANWFIKALHSGLLRNAIGHSD